QTETLTEHQDEVLHVSFAHNGKLFATCSKDCHILVWNSKYPVSLKYQRDLRSYSWKYTQYSQFNESDTLLLVSGVHFGTPHSPSVEIAVFSLQDGFELQCRVMNKPYDIFGTWFSDQYLLSGDLHWLADLVSSSALWLIKASQQTESEHVPITSLFYLFYNRNASSIRGIMVANCLPDSERMCGDEGNVEDSADMECNEVEPVESPSHRDINPGTSHRHRIVDPSVRTQDSLDYGTETNSN
ncbi:F-box and WD repeat domain containing 5, partial [Carabus blaptoides fortunei]